MSASGRVTLCVRVRVLVIHLVIFVLFFFFVRTGRWREGEGWGGEGGTSYFVKAKQRGYLDWAEVAPRPYRCISRRDLFVNLSSAWRCFWLQRPSAVSRALLNTYVPAFPFTARRRPQRRRPALRLAVQRVQRDVPVRRVAHQDLLFHPVGPRGALLQRDSWAGQQRHHGNAGPVPLDHPGASADAVQVPLHLQPAWPVTRLPGLDPDHARAVREPRAVRARVEERVPARVPRPAHQRIGPQARAGGARRAPTAQEW